MTTPTPKTKYPTPEGLKQSGSTLWQQITEKWELRPDELAVLKGACRVEDRIDTLERELEGAPLMVRGSQGQQVINPIIPELRQYEATKKSLLGALNLPDEQGETPRSVGARKAAQSRWGKAG